MWLITLVSTIGFVFGVACMIGMKVTDYVIKKASEKINGD